MQNIHSKFIMRYIFNRRSRLVLYFFVQYILMLISVFGVIRYCSSYFIKKFIVYDLYFSVYFKFPF